MAKNCTHENLEDGNTVCPDCEDVVLRSAKDVRDWLIEIMGDYETSPYSYEASRDSASIQLSGKNVPGYDILIIPRG